MHIQDRQQRDGEASVQAAAFCLASLLAAPTSLVSYHSTGAATDSAASSFTCGSQEAEQSPRNVLRHALDSCLCPQPGFPPPCPCDRQLPVQDMNIIPFCWRHLLTFLFHSVCVSGFQIAAGPFHSHLNYVGVGFGLLVSPWLCQAGGIDFASRDVIGGPGPPLLRKDSDPVW